MNIAFDAKRAFLNPTGLGNYSRTLIKSLLQYFPGNQYTLFTPKTGSNGFDNLVRQYPSASLTLPKSITDKLFRSYWRSYGITKLLGAGNIDVYHGLSNELPFNINEFEGKKIVTIHDLIFLRYPEYYPAADRKIYDAKFKSACLNAEIIVAVSEQTKRDIGSFYFIREEKIKVVYQSCSEGFYRETTRLESGKIKLKYNLPVEYLLHVGTIEERKNLLTILKALTRVKNIPLVVIGRKKEYYSKVSSFIEKNNLGSRVFFPENVLSEDLPEIFRNAKAFIYPSEFEGFGIPIIEALTSKTPVITSNENVFHEAGGPDSIYIDAHDDEKLSVEIKKILSYPELCTQMAEKGFEYAKKFHPEKIAHEMFSVYSEY
jgi:glycosyltransferase involved in cell wall biosynthesis